MDRLAQRYGFSPGELTGGQHLRFRHPNGGIVVTGSTPSDHRQRLHFRSELRRVARASKTTDSNHTVDDRCGHCGEHGHTTKQCPNK